VAAINGPAVGAGLEIALACDLRIASERARFALPQMAMGMLPDCGGLSRLARATSESFAMDMVLTQRVVTAEEALAVGLVSRVVPHEQLSVELDAVASRIEAIPWPGALLATMVIEAGVQMDSRRAADLEAMADQVMLSKEAVWAKASEFINNKGLKGLRPG
jgi:enoyl-CoA hydratase/carnithine racemase